MVTDINGLMKVLIQNCWRLDTRSIAAGNWELRFSQKDTATVVTINIVNGDNKNTQTIEGSSFEDVLTKLAKRISQKILNDLERKKSDIKVQTTRDEKILEELSQFFS